MQDAIERLAKSVDAFASGNQSKSLAEIELVSAFKVIFKRTTDFEPIDRQQAIVEYVGKVVTHVETGRMSAARAIEELSNTYQAAHTGNLNIVEHITQYK